MDETTVTPATSSSSSTAAAAAVNSSKTTAMPAVSATSTVGNTVKLIIKSSNQQYDDYIIESDLQWTVNRLKKQISLVYPSKPAVDDQKLIYAGQLLNEKLQLKDVIRNYKDVYTQNHIFHLVCSLKHPPTARATPPSNNSVQSEIGSIFNMAMNTENLRQRRPTGGAGNNSNNNSNDRNQQQHEHSQQQQQQQQQQHQQQQQTQPMQQFYQHQMPNFNSYYMNPQYIPQMFAASAVNATAQCPNANMMPFAPMAHQAMMHQWMQNVYAQYMDHCIRMSNAGSPQHAMPQMPNEAQPLPFMNPQMPASLAGLGTAVLATSPTSAHSIATAQLPDIPGTVGASVGVTGTATATATVGGTAEPDAGQIDAQQQQVLADEPQRRFQNIVEEEAEDNDWLDHTISFMRFALFITLIYFNASPMRCLFVGLIVVVIYLYNIGVLRVNHERNNNNINRNNNADADQIRQGVQQVQRAQDVDQPENPPNVNPNPNPDADAVPVTDPPTNNEQDNNNNNNNNNNNSNSVSVIGVMRTFVITFFTSLLPEVPAAL